MSKWLSIDQDVKAYEDTLEIPTADLAEVDMVLVKDPADIKKIPNVGGCYWIWTNEEILHSFHSNKFPERFDGGEIIYNGISKSGIAGRIYKHLAGRVTEGMSAISVDLLIEDYRGSHRKACLASKANTAFHAGHRIRDREEVLKLNLSAIEADFVNATQHDLHFRNGINITDDKHQPFDFRVYFLGGFVSASFADIIEKRWRDEFGLPRLCTYSKGR